MNKRLLASVLALVMVFTATACTGDTDDTVTTTTTTTTQDGQTTEDETDAPTEDETEDTTPDGTDEPTETDGTEEPAGTEDPTGTEDPAGTDEPGQVWEAPTGSVTYDLVHEYDDVKEYSFLMAWNGGAGQFPIGFNDGPITKAIEERTGVRLNVETIVSSEREKLATVFMSGTIPDMTNAPHWSTNPGGEGELIKEAAVNGQLLNLVGLYEDFPNVVRSMTVGVSDVYVERDLEHPDYNGGRFVIPTQTPRTNDDVTNWAYNVWVRGDILQDLGYTQEQINNPDTLYEFLKAVQEGGFTDVNGQPVIPAGSWHNGWSYDTMLGSFNDRSMTGWHLDEDGKVKNDMFGDWQEDRLLFMRKLNAEMLFDQESFTQSDSLAREKAATGRVAMLTGHFPHQNDFFAAELYPTNPEMRYVPVGPMENWEGKTPIGYTREGRTGSPVLFFNANVDEPERVLNFVDFINSDEGLLLSLYGIEGEHYSWVDGVPALTDAWKETQATDANSFYLQGYGIGPNVIGADPTKGWGWDAKYEDENYAEAREFAPMEFFTGATLDDLSESWEGRPAYNESLATIDWGDEQERAFLAPSDEEALSILENYRQRLVDAGIEDMTAFLQEQLDNDPDIHW